MRITLLCLALSAPFVAAGSSSRSKKPIECSESLEIPQASPRDVTAQNQPPEPSGPPPHAAPFDLAAEIKSRVDPHFTSITQTVVRFSRTIFHMTDFLSTVRHKVNYCRSNFAEKLHHSMTLAFLDQFDPSGQDAGTVTLTVDEQDIPPLGGFYLFGGTYKPVEWGILLSPKIRRELKGYADQLLSAIRVMHFFDMKRALVYPLLYSCFESALEVLDTVIASLEEMPGRDFLRKSGYNLATYYRHIADFDALKTIMHSLRKSTMNPSLSMVMGPSDLEARASRLLFERTLLEAELSEIYVRLSPLSLGVFSARLPRTQPGSENSRLVIVENFEQEIEIEGLVASGKEKDALLRQVCINLQSLCQELAREGGLLLSQSLLIDTVLAALQDYSQGVHLNDLLEQGPYLTHAQLIGNLNLDHMYDWLVLGARRRSATELWLTLEAPKILSLISAPDPTGSCVANVSAPSSIETVKCSPSSDWHKLIPQNPLKDIVDPQGRAERIEGWLEKPEDTLFPIIEQFKVLGSQLCEVYGHVLELQGELASDQQLALTDADYTALDKVHSAYSLFIQALFLLSDVMRDVKDPQLRYSLLLILERGFPARWQRIQILESLLPDFSWSQPPLEALLQGQIDHCLSSLFPFEATRRGTSLADM